MIPKKIHFCWLSGDEYPPLIKHCIETWKQVLPEYEIVLWDTNRFDINSVAWVKEAYESKKYAFAADYIRLYAVYTEGGIYLDSDVEVLKPFDDLLSSRSFIGFEAATEKIEAAIFGAEKGCEWCKKAMEFYDNRHFEVDKQGGINTAYIAPNIINESLKQLFPDFPEIPVKTPIKIHDNELTVCPSKFFSPIMYDLEKSYTTEKDVAKRYRENPETYCIHRFNASWGIKPSKKLQWWDYFKKRCRKILGEKVANIIIAPIRFVGRLK